MAIDRATSTQTVIGYFTKRLDAKDAMGSLKEAGFMPSQIRLEVRPEYASGGSVDSSADPSATEEAGQKSASMWRKVVEFFEEKCDTDLYSRDRTCAESSSVVVGQPMHGGYGYQCQNDSRESIDKLNISEEQARYFMHHFNQGEEGALITVSATQRAAEAKAILKRHQGDTGESAIRFSNTG